MLPQASRPVIVAIVGAAAAAVATVAAVVVPSLASADTASPTASASPQPTMSTEPSPAPTSDVPSLAPTTAPSTGPAALPQATLPLRKGSVGTRVVTAQQRLAWLGYSITASSQARQLYGDSTIKAVKAFQAKNWLPVTGRIDKKTWRTLGRMAEPVGILPSRCTEKKKAICIDKTTRLLRYVVKGKVAMVADARFGAPGMETGEGLFTIHEKSFNHVSSRYHTWMPRAMFFNGDEAVHFSPDFTAVGYARGSHGCVGLRDMEKATWLFNQVPTGTRVYVYWS